MSTPIPIKLRTYIGYGMTDLFPAVHLPLLPPG